MYMIVSDLGAAAQANQLLGAAGPPVVEWDFACGAGDLACGALVKILDGGGPKIPENCYDFFQICFFRFFRRQFQGNFQK